MPDDSLLYVSPHFTWREVMSHDGTECPPELMPNARLLANEVLEPIRQQFGEPLIVISWYRSPEYNQRVGGAEKSQHMSALAADITPISRLALPRLRSCIETMIVEGRLPLLKGFGVYRMWHHVDARSTNKLARWFGTGVGSENV